MKRNEKIMVVANKLKGMIDKYKNPIHTSKQPVSYQFRGVNKNKFVTSICTSKHPLKNSSKKTKLFYFLALEHFVNSCASDVKYTKARLLQYRNLFVYDETLTTQIGNNIEKTIKAVVDDFLQPWKRQQCFLLFCDIALIIMEKAQIKKAFVMITNYISKRKKKYLNELFEIFYNDNKIPLAFLRISNFIIQFRKNISFVIQQEMRILITATMSAGKSTLINAIVGKPITKTAQEACTNNLCYIYNKPFEDNNIHLLASLVSFSATYDELIAKEKETICNVASFFRTFYKTQARVCLIDTPGVNSAINRDHGKLARKAIIEENYDKLIYILNAHSLGTDDEIKHLKYVYKNVPHNKIIFVINKLDSFRKSDDSVSESIKLVKTDLQKIGYKNPVICPFSAYFSFLLKMKQNNEELDSDEQDVFDLYIKKFNKPEYDLSKYYDKPVGEPFHNGDELMKMSFISGLYCLENILYGEAMK